MSIIKYYDIAYSNITKNSIAQISSVTITIDYNAFAVEFIFMYYGILVMVKIIRGTTFPPFAFAALVRASQYWAGSMVPS